MVRLADIGDAVPAFRLFVLAGLASSNAEARRLIRGGGARIDDAAIIDESELISAHALHAGVRLSSGKKTHRLVQAE